MGHGLKIRWEKSRAGSSPAADSGGRLVGFHVVSIYFEIDSSEKARTGIRIVAGLRKFSPLPKMGA